VPKLVSQNRFQAYLMTLIYVPASLLSFPREGGSKIGAGLRSLFLLLAHPLVSPPLHCLCPGLPDGIFSKRQKQCG
jgi:hypothetical protein